MGNDRPTCIEHLMGTKKVEDLETDEYRMHIVDCHQNYSLLTAALRHPREDAMEGWSYGRRE